MKQCVKQSRKDWIDLFLRECLYQERVTKIPLLFSLDDVKLIIKKVFTRNNKRKYDSFLNYAFKETDLLGNTRRFEEIITHVQQMLDTSQ